MCSSKKPLYVYRAQMMFVPVIGEKAQYAYIGGVSLGNLGSLPRPAGRHGAARLGMHVWACWALLRLVLGLVLHCG